MLYATYLILHVVYIINYYFHVKHKIEYILNITKTWSCSHSYTHTHTDKKTDYVYSLVFVFFTPGNTAGRLLCKQHLNSFNQTSDYLQLIEKYQWCGVPSVSQPISQKTVLIIIMQSLPCLRQAIGSESDNSTTQLICSPGRIIKSKYGAGDQMHPRLRHSDTSAMQAMEEYKTGR